MTGLSFARIFSDGVILQRNKQIHVWGFGTPKGKVTVTLAQSSQQCVVNDAGRFDAYLPAMDKGGPYTLEAAHSDGDSISCSDVWIGDVIMVCGQSNMEFPMERVRETYPDEWKKTDKKLRTFKVIENAVFGRTIRDVVTGQWKSLDPEKIEPFSACADNTNIHFAYRRVLRFDFHLHTGKLGAACDILMHKHPVFIIRTDIFADIGDQ